MHMLTGGGSALEAMDVKNPMYFMFLNAMKEAVLTGDAGKCALQNNMKRLVPKIRN